MVGKRMMLVVLASVGCSESQGDEPGVDADPQQVTPAITYTITAQGISATAIAGQTVAFINNDAAPHQISSNPHPVHTDCPELNNPVLAPAQPPPQFVATLSAPPAGQPFKVCAFHDHLNPPAPTPPPPNTIWEGSVLVMQVPSPPPAPFTMPAITFTLTATGTSATAMAGQTVSFINADTVPHQISSNPHPVHTDCPELNNPVLQPQQTFTATLPAPAAGQPTRLCGFHDHLNPENRSLQGSILVNPTTAPPPPTPPAPPLPY